MGYELPKTPNCLRLEEIDAFSRFRRALRKPDQIALDDLYAAARPNLAATGLSDVILPLEQLLMCLVLEEHKQVMNLRVMIEEMIEAEEEIDSEG